MQDRKARIVRALHYGPLAHARIEQVVEPYGLVAKANVWYLVCAAGGRALAHRVSHIVEAQALDEPFERPPDFDLARFWEGWCAEFQKSRPRYPVAARVAPHALQALSHMLGGRVETAAGDADAEGWTTATLTFETLEDARNRLLSLGGAVEARVP